MLKPRGARCAEKDNDYYSTPVEMQWFASVVCVIGTKIQNHANAKLRNNKTTILKIYDGF